VLAAASRSDHCRPTCRFKQPVTLLDTLLHQHSTGKAVKVRHYRGARELTPIADLRAFDYAYQVPQDRLAHE
jgi:hypothetical protein